MFTFFLRRPQFNSAATITAVCTLTLLAHFARLGAQSSLSEQTIATVDTQGILTATGDGATPVYHPARALVHMRPGAAADFLPGSGPARAFPGDRDLYLVINPPGLSTAEVLRRYRANPNVVYAEPDYVLQAVETTPNDPLWSQQWDMVKIAAPAAWGATPPQTDAGDVVVVVIDTGVDYTHPDLQGNLWSNPSDTSQHGFTCINGSCVAGGADDYGHGTHVAGTIGAVGNNGVGIAGINWSVQILSIKFLNSGGSGYTSDAILAFNKAKELKQQGVNIRITSNSWGGGGFDQSLKDAMAAAEAVGIVHVCAAGNNNQNADGAPMFPAAYDNRGIVSVLATDTNDAGAGFTNFGLASVDIAAPGVNTISTVPTTTCALCDPSGYKLLSGTSMATPHVSGVLAALFHRNPALTADEARDLVLDPQSYDALANLKAQTSSTGGRLNFAKALANPLLLSPVLNNFPTIAIGPDVFASAGSQVNLTATASDPDNDPLRLAWVKSGSSTGSLWLFGWMLNSLFPNPSGNSVSFPAPSLARTALATYDASTADGRGGSDHGRNYVMVSPTQASGDPPSGTLLVSPTDAPAGSTISVTFPATDPDGGTVAWDFWIGQKYGASGSCCYTGTTASVQLNNVGVYRFSTQAIDRELFQSSRSSAVVRIGGATGDPPIVSAAFDKVDGAIPLTVNIDLSGSTDSDGSVASYYFNCGGGTFSSGGQNSKGKCTFDTPGSYWMILQVQDNSGNMDIMSSYAVATPVPPGPDGTPPTVIITRPSPGDVSGNVPITADATDNVGVTRVDFYLCTNATCDVAGRTPIDSATTSPYTITWDSTTTTTGLHDLIATAIDAAGNTGTSAKVSITVDPIPLPTISITNPADGGIVTRKSTVIIQSDVTGDIDHVDFIVGSTPICRVTPPNPYSCEWVVPKAANKTYSIKGSAVDTQGHVTTSTTVTVTAK